MIGRRSSYRLFLLVEFPRPAEQSGAEHLGNLAGWREGVCVDTRMRRPTTMEHASGLVGIRSGQLYFFRLAALVRRVPTIILDLVLVSWIRYRFPGSGGNSWRQCMYINRRAAVVDSLKADTQDLLVWSLSNYSLLRWRPQLQPNTTGS
jgi:hypothetical protein